MSRIGSFLSDSTGASGISSSGGLAGGAANAQGPSIFDTVLQSAQQAAIQSPAAGGATGDLSSDSSGGLSNDTAASSNAAADEANPQSSPSTAQNAPIEPSEPDSDNTNSPVPKKISVNSSKAAATPQSAATGTFGKTSAKLAAINPAAKAPTKAKSGEAKQTADENASAQSDQNSNANNPLNAQAAVQNQVSSDTAAHAGDSSDASAGDAGSKSTTTAANAKSSATISPGFLSHGAANAADPSAHGLSASASAKGKTANSSTTNTAPTPPTTNAPPPTADANASVANNIATGFSAVLGSHISPPAAVGGQAAGTSAASAAAAHAATQAALASASSSDASFVSSNYPSIIQGVHGRLLPDGGSMQISLSPPELGDLQLNVQVRDGALSAIIQTTTDTAARLLGHNLNQLKSSLEGAGVTVEKLQVSQAPRNTASNSDQSQQEERQSSAGNEQTQREQQRREMLRRMWRKVSGNDELDLVA